MNILPCPLKDRNQPETLVDFVAGRLDEQATTAVAEHAAECAACREFIAGQAAVWTALDEVPAVAVPGDFDSRLYARIAAQQNDPWWQRACRRVFESGEPGSWRPAAVLSAACAVALAVLLVRTPVEQKTMPHFDGATIEAAKTGPVDSPDVESIEKALEDVEMLRLVSSTSSL